MTHALFARLLCRIIDNEEMLPPRTYGNHHLHVVSMFNVAHKLLIKSGMSRHLPSGHLVATTSKKIHFQTQTTHMNMISLSMRYFSYYYLSPRVRKG